MTKFHLAIVATADGFIARHSADAPDTWASAEEQETFFSHVGAADWSAMGRHTHAAVEKPEQRRIIFSWRHSGWQRPTQLWLDPKSISPRDLPTLVSEVHPCGQVLILGGTTVHDWFHAHAAINRIFLTIEPRIFYAGLPMFSGHSGDPCAPLERLGYVCQS